MDKKLYEASVQGNVTSLLNLVNEDPFIIHKYIAKPYNSDTPLHLAALLGHVNFARVILTQKPDLAREPDIEGSTALHVASGAGHVEMVKCLMWADVDTCRVLDRSGLNPVHVAAIKGRVDVLREMVRVRPDAARMVTRDGLSILHLCVKYNRLETLRLLVEVDGVVDEELVNFKDPDGNTVLHLAALDKKIQILEFLEKSTRIDRDARNDSGLKASDILNQMSNVSEQSCQKCGNIPTPLEVALSNFMSEQKQGLSNSKKKQKKKEKMQKDENKRNALMIAATVIMSMSFQVAVNPPGGVWQDTKLSDDQLVQALVPTLASYPPGSVDQQHYSPPHIAGVSVFGSIDSGFYKKFVIFNTMAFCGSTFVFLLLLSGLPLLTNNRYVMGVYSVALWVAILSSAACFRISVEAISPNGDETSMLVIEIALVMCLLLLIGHLVRLVWKVIEKCCQCCWRSRNSGPQPYQQGMRV